MNKILIVEPPSNCWSTGYPVSKGETESSLNHTTVYAQENGITANPARLKKSFKELTQALTQSGWEVEIINFPNDLNDNKCLHHDGVFVRDVGFMFQNMWIKANFSARNRQVEADVYASIISTKYNKQVVTLPEGSFVEFGEVYYFETKKGSYYFGGLSRANRSGHEFVTNLIKPDHVVLLESEGYHLDTVFTPVLNSNNELVAVVLAKDMFSPESLHQLDRLGVEIISIDNSDTSDVNGLGNYAVNCLVSPGFLISGARFKTSGVEEKLKELGLKHLVVPLTDYNYAGGSAHCLTREIV